jgi:dTDP-4-dehydrorhamnose reductase
MPQRRVLITGASGLLGGALVRSAPAGIAVLAQTRTHALPPALKERVAVEGRFDLADAAKVQEFFQRQAPDAVIHTAARTSAADCERDPQGARRDNVECTERLVALCAPRKMPFVLISTDMVFDGLHAPYQEDARPAPVGVYGQTKVQAEAAALSHPHALIARVALLFGHSPRRNRSPDEALAAAVARGETVSLFRDEFRTPIHALGAARLLWELLLNGRTGLVHVAGRDRVSRWDLGLALARRLGLPERGLKSSSITEYAGHPPRQPDLTLDTTRLSEWLGRPAPSLAESLALPLGPAGRSA